jgi:hypothetical protein
MFHRKYVVNTSETSSPVVLLFVFGRMGDSLVGTELLYPACLMHLAVVPAHFFNTIHKNIIQYCYHNLFIDV